MIGLLFALRRYCLDALNEISLSSKDRGDLPEVKGFIGEIPGVTDTVPASVFPLLLLRLDDFEDPQAEDGESTLTVHILAGVYNKEESSGDKCSPGYHDLLNLLHRLRLALLRSGRIGDKWRRAGKMEGGPFEMQKYPYYFGDIVVRYSEHRITEEFSAEEEIDIYGSAYGNEGTDDWKYPANGADETTTGCACAI